MASSGGYASMTRRKSEPKLTMPQQLHTLNERMAALAVAQKAVATRCSELDGKISGSVKLVKIAQSYAEQVSYI